jgi:hypothetical protein
MARTQTTSRAGPKGASGGHGPVQIARKPGKQAPTADEAVTFA